MKLGTKVKCKGYFKKVDTKHVALESSRKNIINDNDICKLLNITEDLSDNTIFIEDEVSQDIKTIVFKEFEGVVVAKKSIALARWYEVVDESYGYGDVNVKSGIKVTHHRYTDCYQVFFRMGGSRLVPIEMCEVDHD